MEAGYKYNRRKITLIFLSIVLHFLLLFFILFDVKLPFKQVLSPDTSPALKKEWATRNPGRSRFGAPVVFKTPAQQPVQPKKQTTQVKQEKVNQSIKTKRPVVQKKKQPQAQAQKKDKALEQSAKNKAQDKHKPVAPSRTSQQSQLSKKLTMAHLLQGFLEQKGTGTDTGIRHKGSNKKAPDEQIKYERYAQKVHWCIQNAFRIHKHKLLLAHAVRSLMRLCIEFQDNGLVKEVKLLQASGSPQLDQFMIELVKDAGKSFPPFPAFLDKNLLPKVYTLQVDIPAATRGSNLMMSM